MKRIIALVLVIASLAILLCACGKFECDFCGEEKSGKKGTGKVAGESVTYCEDCEDAYKLAKEIGDLGDELGDLFN